MKLHVTNLAPRVTEDQLRQVFGQFGQVLSLDVKWSQSLGRASGTAVIEMYAADALAAARSLNGRPLRQRHIYITPMGPLQANNGLSTSLAKE